MSVCCRVVPHKMLQYLVIPLIPLTVSINGSPLDPTCRATSRMQFMPFLIASFVRSLRAGANDNVTFQKNDEHIIRFGMAVTPMFPLALSRAFHVQCSGSFSRKDRQDENTIEKDNACTGMLFGARVQVAQPDHSNMHDFLNPDARCG